MEIKANSVQEAFGALWNEMSDTNPLNSRNGVCKELVGVHVKIDNPSLCLFRNNKRKDYYLAKLYEALWVVNGNDHISYLSKFIPRAVDYADDGKVWRGAYGPRIRRWNSSPECIDQLTHCIELLIKDPETRRAVISIYDPQIDVKDGKDIPCNNFIQFLIRNDKLHILVYQRSCDLLWGWTGINSFEWFFLQTVVAQAIGKDIGSYYHTFGSLHVYKDMYTKGVSINLWKRCDDIVTSGYNHMHEERGYRMLETLPFIINSLYSIDELIELQHAMEKLVDVVIGEEEIDKKVDQIGKIVSDIPPDIARVFFIGFGSWAANNCQPYTFELASELARYEREMDL